tara:strand:+ start:26038 stop:26598 length:561 start_codon:yes stop_codon:yes gene_type:complete
MHILKTAARVFADEGIARASMSQVAKACNISKATIYHYYDCKEALLFDILDTYLKDLRDQLYNLSLDACTPDEQLGLFVREALIAYDGMDAEHKIQTEGITHLTEGRQSILKQYQRDMVTQLTAIIAQIAPERFDGDAKLLRFTTMSVFGMLNWFYMWNKTADPDTRLAYADVVTQLTINGIKGPS